MSLSCSKCQVPSAKCQCQVPSAMCQAIWLQNMWFGVQIWLAFVIDVQRSQADGICTGPGWTIVRSTLIQVTGGRQIAQKGFFMPLGEMAKWWKMTRHWNHQNWFKTTQSLEEQVLYWWRVMPVKVRLGPALAHNRVWDATLWLHLTFYVSVIFEWELVR